MTTVNRTQVRLSINRTKVPFDWSIMSGLIVRSRLKFDHFLKTVQSYREYLLLNLPNGYSVYYRRERTNGKNS